jgi:Tfp pilus assembly protein PilO
VAFGVLALVLVFLLVLPKMEAVGETGDRLQQTQLEESALGAELARLLQAEQEAPRLRQELAKLRRAVPPVADLPGLINQLQDTADVAGVDFFSISPGTPLPAVGTAASEIPAQVQVIGGFFAIDEFMFRLETLPRSSKVVSVTLAEGPDQLPQLDIQMEVRFYTTDLEAGPGAPPPATPTEEPGVTPSPEASPGESPAPASPAPTPTGG